jgi:hypothetical protein
MKETLSVEIFRDADNTELDITPVQAGVSMVADVVPQLQIVKDTRKIRLGASASEALRAESIRWPHLESDLSIVVTERELKHDKSARYRLGFTERWLQKGKSLAIIDSLSLGVEFTTAHELGHMLGLQTPYPEDPHHCLNATCLMRASQTKTTQFERIQKKGLGNILERYGLRAAEYLKRDVALENAFCDTCKQDIARRSFFLIKFLDGDKSIPLNWL